MKRLLLCFSCVSLSSFFVFISISIASLFLISCVSVAGGNNLSGLKPNSPMLNVADVAVTANRAADWQLAHMQSFDYVRTFRDHTENPHGWFRGLFLLV